jgi:hypothetical protein
LKKQKSSTQTPTALAGCECGFPWLAFGKNLAGAVAHPKAPMLASGLFLFAFLLNCFIFFLNNKNRRHGQRLFILSLQTLGRSRSNDKALQTVGRLLDQLGFSFLSAATHPAIFFVTR